MTLQADLASGVSDLFSAFASVAESITYKRIVPDVDDYDPVADTYAQTPTNKGLSALVDTDRRKARDDTPLSEKESWLMVEQSAFATAFPNVTPNPEADTIERTINGVPVTATLKEFDQDPAKTLWNLHIQQP